MEINIHHYSQTLNNVSVYTTQVEKIAPKTTTSVTINGKMIDF